MTLVRFSRKPFERNFNSVADHFFTDFPLVFKNDGDVTQWQSAVPVNIKETEKSYQLEIVAPGFEKADFNIHLDQDILTISAEKKSEEKKETEKQIRREYASRSFKRSFTLDEKIDATNTDASYVNGILVLNLPKKEAVKASAKEIVIK